MSSPLRPSGQRPNQGEATHEGGSPVRSRCDAPPGPWPRGDLPVAARPRPARHAAVQRLHGGLSTMWARSPTRDLRGDPLALVCSLIVVVINTVLGTVIAWQLVRDRSS
jgi:hypothetical protein